MQVERTNVTVILKEPLLLPATSAIVKLGNSSLGFIRSPKRNSMSENKLNVSLLLLCHKDIFVIASILTILHI